MSSAGGAAASWSSGGSSSGATGGASSGECVCVHGTFCAKILTFGGFIYVVQAAKRDLAHMKYKILSFQEHQS